MRIAIDARAFYWTGVGRYIRNILREFRNNSHGHVFTILVPEGKEKEIQETLEGKEYARNYPANLPPPLTPPRAGGENASFRYIGVEPSYYSLQEQTRFLLQLNKLDVDLVHFMHFNVPYFYRRPYVVTIHDITRFIFPGQKRQLLLQQLAYEAIFAHAVARARQVIAVSKTTEADMRHLPFSSVAPITTIYEGVDPEFVREVSLIERQKVRLLLGTDRPFFLFVGVWMSHKNLVRLLDAYQIVRSLHPEIALVITGKPVPGYSNLVAYVRHNQLEHDVLFPGFVPHALLPALYAESKVFVFPSLYEGFGLPPLEAMLCGTPVIASNVSSIPELLKDAAQYVNPESVQDIARGMLYMLEHGEYAENLAEKGRARAAMYSWGTAAQQHIAVYENSLTKNRNVL